MRYRILKVRFRPPGELRLKEFPFPAFFNTVVFELLRN